MVVIAVIIVMITAVGAAVLGAFVLYSNSIDDTPTPTPSKAPSIMPSPTNTYVPSPSPSKKPSPSPTPSIVRPQTGTYITDNTRGLGASEVTVKNGLDNDAVIVLVKVYDPSYTVMAVYVRAHDSYTINVDRTLYYMYYTTGQDWDSINKEFTRYKALKMFDEEFDFHDYYWEVTLNPVVNGNSETSYVDPGDFPSI